MQVELGEVYTIKISNGDEIIAKIVNQTDNEYQIQRPLVVIPGPQGIQLISGLFTADPEKSVTLNKSAISMIVHARAEVRDSYTEATTGIKPVTNKILMG